MMTKEQMNMAERCIPYYGEEIKTEKESRKEWKEFEEYVEKYGFPESDELPF